MTSVQANGITIEYETYGSGDPLLLVMGLGGQLVDWPQPFIDALVNDGFRVIVFDNRDSGLSTEFDAKPPTMVEMAKAVVLRRPMPSQYQLSDMAADAIGVMDEIGIERFHVVGMSMGGMIAQLLAIGYPDRVLSLTSVMSTTGHRKVGRPTAAILKYMMSRPAPSRADAIDTGVDLFRRVSGPTFDEAEFRRVAANSVERSFRPGGTARQTAAILATGDRTEMLQRLDLPTLVVHGLVDPLVRPSGGIATAKAVPGSRLLMFNDMGHDLPVTRHREMADAIDLNARRAVVPANA